MSRYMNLIGQNARKASLQKVNTKTKNKVLKRYASLLDEKKILYLRQMLKMLNLL